MENKYNSSLKIFSGLTTGEVNISEHSQYNYINAEKVTIHENIVARVYGTVKDVTLKKNSRIYVHGKILGTVTNEGGEIRIFDLNQNKP